MSYPDNFPKPNEPPEPKIPADRPKNSEFANQAAAAASPQAQSASPTAQAQGKETPAALPQAKPKPDFKLILLYGLLICVGIVIAYYAFNFFAPQQKAAGTANTVSIKKSAFPPLISAKNDKAKQQAITLESVSAKKEEKPFLAIKKRMTQAASSYTLSGIFYSGEKNYCIINDKVLSEGDTVDNAKVVSIGTEEVQLQIGDKTTKLNLRTSK